MSPGFVPPKASIIHYRPLQALCQGAYACCKLLFPGFHLSPFYVYSSPRMLLSEANSRPFLTTSRPFPIYPAFLSLTPALIKVEVWLHWLMLPLKRSWICLSMQNPCPALFFRRPRFDFSKSNSLVTLPKASQCVTPCTMSTEELVFRRWGLNGKLQYNSCGRREWPPHARQHSLLPSFSEAGQI
jgi:hypothetical protein